MSLPIVLKLKAKIKSMIPEKYMPAVVRMKGACLGYGQKSYAQHGEDLILRAICGPKHEGFYVDVGAHHPHFLSNTYYFYRRGWQGINIDAMPNSMKTFRKARKRDVNLELAISNNKQLATFYMFNNSCLNTFSAKYAEALQKDAGIKLVAEKKITTTPLSEVLDQYVPHGRVIDFLSVDVEEYDVEVLKSNNWERYRPRVVVVEAHNFSLASPEKSAIYTYMLTKNYQLHYVSVENLFFLLRSP